MDDLLIGQTLRYSDDPFRAGTSAAHAQRARRSGAARRRRSWRWARRIPCCAPIPGAGARLWHVPDFCGLHRRPCALPADRDHRVLGQAADRLAQHLYLPRRNALCRPRLCRRHRRPLYGSDAVAWHHHVWPATATIHPESVDAFFEAAQTRGMRAWAGKTCMDRNAPDGLRDTAQSAYDDSKRLLEKWHGVDRLSYVITPRFSPTSTPEQLAAPWARFGPKTRAA